MKISRVTYVQCVAPERDPQAAEMHAGHTWAIPPNALWNLPAEADEVHFETEQRGTWGQISHVAGLAMSRDGRIYGERTLQKARESGYAMEGSVNIAGKRYRAFTSSQLFVRHMPDDSACDSRGQRDGACNHLCDVAILYVCLDQPK